MRTPTRHNSAGALARGLPSFWNHEKQRQPSVSLPAEDIMLFSAEFTASPRQDWKTIFDPIVSYFLLCSELPISSEYGLLIDL